MRETFKLVTYNIHSGRNRAGRPTLDGIAAALAETGADVIACQEVLGVPTAGHSDQAQWLAERLGMHACFVANAETRFGPLGNATLQRRPIAAHDNLDLSVRGFERRGALRTTSTGEPGLEVWNVHLGLTRRQRRAQWRQLAGALDASDRPVVVCGDFNDWDGAVGRRITRAGLRGAMHGAPRSRRTTFPARRPWLALDRVYYRGLEVVEAGVLRGAPWPTLSDHLPVEVTLGPGAAPETAS